MKRKCSRRISFADQSGSDSQTDSQEAEAVEYGSTLVEPNLNSLAASGFAQCNHHCCNCNGHNSSGYTDEIGHKTFLVVNACAANANEMRPTASVLNNNARFGFNTVYCRGIFTSDDDADETLPPNNVKDSIGSTPSQRGMAVNEPCLLYTSPSPRDS